MSVPHEEVSSDSISLLSVNQTSVKSFSLLFESFYTNCEWGSELKTRVSHNESEQAVMLHKQIRRITMDFLWHTFLTKLYCIHAVEDQMPMGHDESS